MSYPADRKYTKDHEWIRLSGEIAEIGITDFAQEQLGDVVFVELPEPGRKVTAGESFGSIESVKAVSELFAPASGEVIESEPFPQGSSRSRQRHAARDVDGESACVRSPGHWIASRQRSVPSALTRA